MEASTTSHKRKHTQDHRGSEDQEKIHKKHMQRQPSPESSTEPYRLQLSKAEKLQNLLSALDDVLDPGSTEDARNYLGQETFEACVDLRSKVGIKAHSLPSPAAKSSHSPEPSQLPTQTNIPRSIPPFSISRWTSSTIPTTLPPLPPILDRTLETGTFIHQGCTKGNAHDLSYERLEWVGDAYLYLISTLLISQTFPSLPPGRCAQLRELVVKNVTLADYACQYGFHDRAKLPEAFSSNATYKAKESEKIKIMGDIFESYIAAVVLSDPVNGLESCSRWLKGLLGMTLREEIIQQEKRTQYDSPLWRLRWSEEPVAKLAPKPVNVTDMPAKDQLRLVFGKAGKLTYKDMAPPTKDPNTKLAVFKVGVYLDGFGEKDKELGVGSAPGKKAAGTKAAEMALSNQKMMDYFREKKRMYDVQQKLDESVGKDPS